jgi:uncharacterized membrane protein YphA (DoxX/SURF4 family)
MKQNQIFRWVLRLIAAVIMLQTLYFKFSGAEESIYIFSTMGIEPWGRIGTGIAELIASALLLIPATTVFGAVMAMGIMGGAIASHLFVLGIEVKGDGGQLFAYASIVFVCTAILFWQERSKIFSYIKARKV